MKRYLLSVFVGFSLLALTSCGYHLRGSATLPDSLKTMYVQGISLQKGLGFELKRSLMRNDVTVTNNYSEGSAVFTVLENKVGRRVLSVGGDAKVSEYELYGLIKFSVSDGDGRVLLDAQKMEAQRSYQFNPDQILGKDEEEQLLRKQLNKQLVSSIMRRLSALK